MSRFLHFFSTSIGQKQLMAVTGLVWLGFLVGHLSGNFLLLAGPETFNAYAEFLSNHPLLIPVEIFMLTVLLAHVFLAIRITVQNRAARGSSYQFKQASGATLASRSMIFSGLVVFFFLVIHLINFKYGGYEDHELKLYGLVMDQFAQPEFAVMYILFMVVLGAHLIHAIQSVFQTFGWNHPAYTPALKNLGYALALILAGGFAALPLWAWLIFEGGA